MILNLFTLLLVWLYSNIKLLFHDCYIDGIGIGIIISTTGFYNTLLTMTTETTTTTMMMTIFVMSVQHSLSNKKVYIKEVQGLSNKFMLSKNIEIFFQIARNCEIKESLSR